MGGHQQGASSAKGVTELPMMSKVSAQIVSVTVRGSPFQPRTVAVVKDDAQHFGMEVSALIDAAPAIVRGRQVEAFSQCGRDSKM